MLKPGGRMVVSDIVAEDLPEWMYENKKLYCSCVSGAISEKKYLSGLRQVGLEQVKVYVYLNTFLNFIKPTLNYFLVYVS